MNDTADRPRLGVLLGATSEREADEFEELAAQTLALLAVPIEPPSSLRAAVLSSLSVPVDPAAAFPAQASPAADPRHRSVAPPVGLLGRRRFRGDARTVLAALDQTPDASHASTGFLDGAATITVVSSPSAKAAVAIVAGLPQPPAGHAYQFWTIRNGRPRGAGTFLPDADARAEVRLTGRYRSADVVAITVEPTGGSRRPTTEPLFALQS